VRRGRRALPGEAAVGARGPLLALAHGVHGAQLGPRRRLALAQHRETYAVALDLRDDLQRHLVRRPQAVQLFGGAGHRLGEVAKQERRLPGAGEHAVLADADHRQAARARDRGPQAVGRLVDLERAELAGRMAEVYFSEQAEAGDPRFILKIAHTQLWL